MSKLGDKHDFTPTQISISTYIFEPPAALLASVGEKRCLVNHSQSGKRTIKEQWACFGFLCALANELEGESTIPSGQLPAALYKRKHTEKTHSLKYTDKHGDIGTADSRYKDLINNPTNSSSALN